MSSIYIILPKMGSISIDFETVLAQVQLASARSLHNITQTQYLVTTVNVGLPVTTVTHTEYSAILHVMKNLFISTRRSMGATYTYFRNSKLSKLGFYHLARLARLVPNWEMKSVQKQVQSSPYRFNRIRYLFYLYRMLILLQYNLCNQDFLLLSRDYWNPSIRRSGS
jgi:hypothetical protein